MQCSLALNVWQFVSITLFDMLMENKVRIVKHQMK